MYNDLSRNSLITIYKSFIQPHLDYGAIIFDQSENEFFLKKKIESLQYNAALAITGAIQGTSRGKVYRELSLEKLYCSFKIKNNGIPSYLAELILLQSHLYNTRNTRNFTRYTCNTDGFKYSFFQ